MEIVVLVEKEGTMKYLLLVVIIFSLIFLVACRPSVPASPIADNSTSEPFTPTAYIIVSTPGRAPSATYTPPLATFTQAFITQTATPTPVKWVRYERTNDNFAVSLPIFWQPTDPNSQILDKYQQIFRQQIQELQKIFSSQKVEEFASSGIIFHAADIGRLKNPAQPTGMLYVIKINIGLPLPLEAFIQANINRLGALLEAGSKVSVQHLNLANRQATELKFRLTVKDAQGEVIIRDVTQYILMDSEVIYLLTMHCPPEKTELYQAEFEEIGKTFEILD